MESLVSKMAWRIRAQYVPVQVQVVFHARVVPDRVESEAQSEPEDAPDRPH